MRCMPILCFLLIFLEISPIDFPCLQALTSSKGTALGPSNRQGTQTDERPKDQKIVGKHGVSIFGLLKYPSHYTHFSYANPEAPKGGMLKLGALGSFDSLNPWIIKGTSADQILLTQGTLLAQSFDENGSSYAYIAQSVSVAEDGKSVTFYLNREAIFDNGKPITAQDVLFSFDILRKEGLPLFRSYYKHVVKIQKISDYAVQFSFDKEIRELPQILGQFPIFSYQYNEKNSFKETKLRPPYPPSSGPYRIHKVIPGRTIVYKRLDKWWGENVSSQRGQHNFDQISVDYYRDSNALLEAFKAHHIDMRVETRAKLWETAYNFPDVLDHKVIKKEIEHSLPQGGRGFFFNTRRSVFKDRRVRQALTMIFDFEWVNQNLFYGRYERALSYFPNSEFGARESLSLEEQKILAPYKEQLPQENLSESFKLPVMQTDEERREIQRQCLQLLEEAGWILEKGILVNEKTRVPFSFEFLIKDQSLEKIFLTFGNSLKKIGIHTKLRLLDAASYEERLTHLNFDCIFEGIPPISVPGNELRDYFGSKEADTPGTRNFSGVKSPVIDRLIESLLVYQTHEELVRVSRVIDRVLLEGFYMIPAWYSAKLPIAYWDSFGMPDKIAPYNPASFSCWWFDPTREAALKKERPSSVSSWKKKILSFF